MSGVLPDSAPSNTNLIRAQRFIHKQRCALGSDDSGQVLTWPPNPLNASRSADFGGTAAAPFAIQPVLAGTTGTATLGVRASTVTVPG